MKAARSAAEISAAFLYSCNAELDALKPGNVHRYAPGHGMKVLHFEQAAEAAAGPIAAADASVGQRILHATEASVAATGLNTNLGIVLLCAPLAKAAHEATFDVGIRRRLGMILSALDEQDAEDAFAAIRIANPAGMGKVDQGDVNSQPQHLTLLAAMRLAADRDRIANAYISVYADVFDFALPIFQEAKSITNRDSTLAVTTLHMALLAEFADTHITRKFGAETAENVRNQARVLKPQWSPIATAKSLPALQEFDAKLKHAGLNPGTTADFVVTTLFANALIERKET